jgi:cyclic pyranopterin phosphate synthase
MTPKINYLRMSITDRCNLRCFYCTYWQDWEKLAAAEILRYEELLRVAGVAARLGIRKIRLTGEP